MELLPPEVLGAVALWSGANALFMLALGPHVSRMRIRLGAGVGTGGDAKLERAIRAHSREDRCLTRRLHHWSWIGSSLMRAPDWRCRC